ncbi:MAG: phosphomannomutase/phosphoglucomutase [Bdellovibrionales bacterium]|nr:phosphomannomutase/phosphoglucomutase [Bdellovibrionales bacterium]
MKPVIFREYDIRGVYNEEFDLDFVEALGMAYATMLKNKTQLAHPTITIGHDARLSSPDIVQRLLNGVTAKGVHVLKLGLVTTPISYFSTFTVKDVVGSIMVTGSHNPPNYNGFKISIGNTTIHGSDIKELEQIINKKNYCANGVGSSRDYDIFADYVSRYREEFGQLKDIPLVVDCGNGAAGSIVRKLYEAVGLHPHFLFEKPDGHFPNHHPDPTVEENLQDLAQKVKEVGAVIGIGFDGDADRIGMVDHEGHMILGDEILAFCARAVLKENPGQKIIGDVKCSDRVFADIEKHGGQAIMWKTGHSLIKDKVRSEQAPFGGELSGHIFFNDRNYGYDDAPYAGLRIIEVLAKTGKNFRELLDLPSAYNTPEIRIDTTEEKKILIVEAVKKAYLNSHYQVNLIDGIRISFPDGWALVRASNTQPVLVLRFESSTNDGLQTIRSQIEEIVRPLL